MELEIAEEDYSDGVYPAISDLNCSMFQSHYQ